MWISRRHIGSGKSRKDWDRSPILLQTFGKWTDPGWSCVSSIKTKSQLMRKWIILMLNFCTTCWLPRIHILWHLGTYNKWGGRGRGVIFPKGPKACLSPVIFDYFLVPIPKILLNITWIREKRSVLGVLKPEPAKKLHLVSYCTDGAGRGTDLGLSPSKSVFLVLPWSASIKDSVE